MIPMYTQIYSKVHGANMGPTWVLSAPDGSHIVPMNLGIRVGYDYMACVDYMTLMSPKGLLNLIMHSFGEKAVMWLDGVGLNNMQVDLCIYTNLLTETCYVIIIFLEKNGHVGCLDSVHVDKYITQKNDLMIQLRLS